jgi:hypothetical protein
MTGLVTFTASVVVEAGTLSVNSLKETSRASKVAPYTWAYYKINLKASSITWARSYIDHKGGIRGVRANLRQKSKRKSSKSRFFAFHLNYPLYNTMNPPLQIPRIPLCEILPNSRSQVVATRNYRAYWTEILQKENLSSSTC